MTNTPGGRRHWWWPPQEGLASPRAPGARTDGDQTTAGAVQLAIGLLTSSLDSPQLEAWAVEALIAQDAEGLGDFMAGLHVVSQMLLHELQQATGIWRQPRCNDSRSWLRPGEGRPPARAVPRASDRPPLKTNGHGLLSVLVDRAG